jgi:hypothetical protein
VRERLAQGARPEWVPAGELRPGWLLAYPVSQEKEDRATLAVPGLGEVPVDEDLLTLAGYYLAAGTLGGRDGKPDQLFFSFHDREAAYVERLGAVLRRLGTRPAVRRRRNTAEVVASSLALGDMLARSFGRGAHRKQLPDWVMRLPYAKQAALVRALWEGNGYVGRVGGYWRAAYGTSSPTLGIQVHQLLLRLGIPAFLHHRDQAGRRRNWVVSVTASTALARLADVLGRPPLAGGEREAGQAALDERTFYVGVRSVRRVPWEGHVPGAALHNCEVNGPGEARAADIGVAGGKGIGLIFRSGQVIRKVPEAEILSAMREEVQRFLAERRAAAAAAVPPTED